MLKILITVLMVALVVWSIVRILDQRRAAGTSTALRQDRKRPGVAAPDDDPEFLWRLERERRRNRKDLPKPSQGDPASDETRSRDDQSDEPEESTG